MIVTRNNEYVELPMTDAEFAASSLPLKGWSIYTGPWPLPVPVPVPVPVVPESITPRQARLILQRNGLLTAVNALVASLGTEAELEWEYCTSVERSNPILNAVAAAAGMTPAQLDTMFQEAAAL